MASDSIEEVSLRSKQKKQSRGSILFTMSRRRISCKDLGNADCQGWLYKKKEKSFLGNKWKKIWAVLKGSCLYWYTSKMAEKAEGFIHLPDFIINPAIECKKKHAMKISQPNMKTFYFAAESREEMNKWLNKLGLAVITQPVADGKEDCWSESEHDEQDTATESLPCRIHDPSNSSESRGHTLTRNSGSSLCIMEYQKTISSLQRTCSSSAPELEKLFLEQDNNPNGEIHMLKTDFGSLSCISIEHEAVFCNHVSPLSLDTGKLHINSQDDDEMERLYKSLEQASLSPIGDRRPSTKRDLRKSFIKRSKNPSINEKLHKIRTLNSTLKCKEHDLAMINQLLESGEITSAKYREWKGTNPMLFQDIYSSPCFQDFPNATKTTEIDS